MFSENLTRKSDFLARGGPVGNILWLIFLVSLQEKSGIDISLYIDVSKGILPVVALRSVIRRVLLIANDIAVGTCDVLMLSSRHELPQVQLVSLGHLRRFLEICTVRGEIWILANDAKVLVTPNFLIRQDILELGRLHELLLLLLLS